MISVNLIATIILISVSYIERGMSVSLSELYIFSVGLVSLSLPAAYHQLNLLYHKFYSIE